MDNFKDFVQNMGEGCKKMIEIGEGNWDRVTKSELILFCVVLWLVVGRFRYQEIDGTEFFILLAFGQF